jgi:hypothetical protein
LFLPGTGPAKSDVKMVPKRTVGEQRRTALRKKTVPKRKKERRRGGAVIFVISSRSTTKLRQRWDLRRDPPHLKVDLQGHPSYPHTEDPYLAFASS